jgi:hypothetical protein
MADSGISRGRLQWKVPESRGNTGACRQQQHNTERCFVCLCLCKAPTVVRTL